MEPERGSSPIVPTAKTDACASPPPVMATAPPIALLKGNLVKSNALPFFLSFPFFAFGTRRDTGRSFEIFNPSHLMFSS